MRLFLGRSANALETAWLLKKPRKLARGGRDTSSPNLFFAFNSILK